MSLRFLISVMLKCVCVCVLHSMFLYYDHKTQNATQPAAMLETVILFSTLKRSNCVSVATQRNDDAKVRFLFFRFDIQRTDSDALFLNISGIKEILLELVLYKINYLDHITLRGLQHLTYSSFTFSVAQIHF